MQVLLFYLFLFFANVLNGIRDTKTFLKIDRIKDITTSKSEFCLFNKNFCNTAIKNVTSNDIKLQFLSGTAAYIRAIDCNIVIERMFIFRKNDKYIIPIPQKSYLIYSFWSKNWEKKIRMPKILDFYYNEGTIFSKNSQNSRFEGFEDPRLEYFEDKNILHLRFHLLLNDGTRQMFLTEFDPIILFNNTGMEQKKFELILLQHESNIRLLFEKNWANIFLNQKLYYVQSLSPLRIIYCNKIIHGNYLKNEVSQKTKLCEICFNGPKLVRGERADYLRGGTSWYKIKEGIFFSIVRSNLKFRSLQFPFYRFNLAVLKFELNTSNNEWENPKLNFISKPIVHLDDKLFYLVKTKKKNLNILFAKSICIPISIVNFDVEKDYFEISYYLIDEINVVARLHGVVKFLKTNMEFLEENKLNQDFVKIVKNETLNYYGKTFGLYQH